MIPQDVLDKRQDFRIPVSTSVQVSLPETGPPARGEMRDISNGGMRLYLDKHLRIGQEYRMYIGPRPGHDGVLVSGSPVWVRYECGAFEIGCRFTSEAPPLAALQQPRRPQRVTLRVDAEYPVRLSDAVGPVVRGLTRDLSWTGARMLSPAPFQSGTVLVATFDFRTYGEMTLPVDIVRCTPAGSHYDLGLAFHALPDGCELVLETVLRHHLEQRAGGEQL